MQLPVGSFHANAKNNPSTCYLQPLVTELHGVCIHSNNHIQRMPSSSFLLISSSVCCYDYLQGPHSKDCQGNFLRSIPTCRRLTQFPMIFCEDNFPIACLAGFYKLVIKSAVGFPSFIFPGSINLKGNKSSVAISCISELSLITRSFILLIQLIPSFQDCSKQLSCESIRFCV